MQFTKLTSKQTYLLSISPNEDIVTELERFVKEHSIQSGYLFGIGALKSVRVAHYSVPHKKYSERRIKKALEISNLSGIITSAKVHVHITLSNEQGKASAGHLVRGVVSAACEIVLVETKEKIERKRNEEIGLDLLAL